jgi:hypothetical protein
MMRCGYFALLAAVIAAGGSVASALPATSCDQAWKAMVPQGKHAFHIGEDDYPKYAARVRRADCYKEWTVLVYMAADNDLTPYAYWDLYEMEAGYESGRNYGGSTIRNDLVVQLDTAGDRGVRRLHVFQAPEPYNPHLDKADFDTRTEEDIRSPVAMRVPEEKTTEAAKLRKFLEWGISKYPSRHYMVVVWGHGQGWISEKGVFAGRRFGGLAFNSSQGTYLDIPSLKETLEGVSKDLLGGKPIDLYASDACLMQMAEVATELSGAARFVVGSTQVQNFLGLPYRRLLYEMNTGRYLGERRGSKSPSEDLPYLAAKMLPKIFKASMQPGGLQGRLAPEGIKSITMSAISSSELREALMPALKDLNAAITDFLAEDPLRGIDLQQLLMDAPSVQGGAKDLGSFLTLLKNSLRSVNGVGVGGGQGMGGNGGGQGVGGGAAAGPAASRLLVAVERAQGALGRTVLNYALGTDYSEREQQLYLLGFRAFTVWLPVSEQEHAARIADFAKSLFYRATGWAGWLAAVFPAGE